MKKLLSALALSMVLLFSILLSGCNSSKDNNDNTDSPSVTKTVPHEATWGIYSLDLATEGVEIVYSSPDEIYSSALRLNGAGDTLVFAQKIDGSADTNTEICTVGVDGSNFRRITNNSLWDLYPVWSPDGTRIAFLSKRATDLDLYVMDANGSNQRKLYDSGSHDADVDWATNTIVFTSGFKIWTIKDDGTQPTQITNPANAGQWGTANLPIGDYDPRLSTDGTKIAFERLEDPNTQHGSYNLFVTNANGSSETRLTSTGYSQGLPSWSHAGTEIVYVVAAINDQGKYDIYMMKADGANNHSITPDYFPTSFLCHASTFSQDDSKVYFIGQWWE